MHQSEIRIGVTLDDTRMPEAINWQAADSGTPGQQQAKAMLLSLWDGQEKTALRIDLWTKKMMVDEMNDFIYQTLAGIANTYSSATQNTALAAELKAFAQEFHRKATEALAEG